MPSLQKMARPPSGGGAKRAPYSCGGRRGRGFFVGLWVCPADPAGLGTPIPQQRDGDATVFVILQHFAQDTKVAYPDHKLAVERAVEYGAARRRTELLFDRERRFRIVAEIKRQFALLNVKVQEVAVVADSTAALASAAVHSRVDVFARVAQHGELRIKAHQVLSLVVGGAEMLRHQHNAAELWLQLKEQVVGPLDLVGHGVAPLVGTSATLPYSCFGFNKSLISSNRRSCAGFSAGATASSPRSKSRLLPIDMSLKTINIDSAIMRKLNRTCKKAPYLT